VRTFYLSFCIFLLGTGETLVAQTDFLDTTFNPGTGAQSGFVESMVLQPDGKILICGNFALFNGEPRSYIARLNSDGSLDPGFSAHPNYWVRSMALQPDGKIVIGGFFTAVDGQPRNRVARLNADGSVDTSFDPGAGCEGKIVPVDPTDPFLFAVGIQTDGKIVIGGNFTTYNKSPRSGIARLNPDGSLDTSFNVGSGVDSWIRSILILPNEQILLSGWFENYNSRGHDRMVRLNPDGSADESFKTQIGYSTAIYSMAWQSDGKVVVGGHSINTNSLFSQEVVRLNQDGSYDLSFNPGGEGADDKVESVVLQPDGKILIGGYFSLYNGIKVKNIARLNSDGTLDTEFTAASDNWIWDIAVQSDDKFLIAGAFSTVNGVSRNGIARLNFTKDPPPPPVVELPPVELPTNTFVFWHLNGTNVVDSAAIPDHPALDPAWQFVAFADANGDGQGDAIYQNTNGQIAAWFTTNSAFSRFGILKRKLKLWRALGASDGLSKRRAEILLHRPDGRFALLKFKKGKSTGAGIFSRKVTVDPTWKFIGLNDFDGNKSSDVLWQDESGQLVLWLLRGTRLLSPVSLNADQAPGPDWRAVALGDINGDQHKDIFQNQNGNVAAWLMNGTNVLSAVELSGVQPVGADWQIVGVNARNAGNQNDLVWKTK